MTDKIIQFHDDSGDLVPVKAVDNGDGTYAIQVDAAITASGLTVGAVDQGNGGASAWLVTGPLTNTQLRATPVTVSGGYLTNTELRASYVETLSHGLTKQVDVTPTLTVASGYVTGDYVGTSGTPITFSGCAALNGGTGIVLGALVVDAAKQNIQGELWLFDDTVTPPNDSAAWSISDADAKKCIGIIPAGDTARPYYSSALNGICPVGSLNIIFKAQSSSTNLYGCFVTRGSPTYANGDLTFRLRILQD